MKRGIVLYGAAALITVMVLSCAYQGYTSMTGTKMNRLELGMSKRQVTAILGREYIISEKRMEEGVVTEVLTYRNYPYDNELYMFVFHDDALVEWYMEIMPRYETILKQTGSE